MDCEIPARHHYPRGAPVPCAWTVRIEPPHRFPVSSPLSRGGVVSRRRRLRRNTPEAHQQLSPPRGNLAVPLSARALPAFYRGTPKLREKNHLLRATHHQARESSVSGGLAG